MTNYLRPKNQEECIQALIKKTEGWTIIAGGTDLVVHNRYLTSAVPGVIDLMGVEEYRSIRESENEVWIGAAVTMTELSRDPVICEWFPALAKAASMVGSTQIRNRATIGGNVANAAHCADTVPPLCAYEATGCILNQKGSTREVPITDLIVGSCCTILLEDEILTGFRIHKQPTLSAFGKIGSRKAVTISKLNACINLILDQERIQESRVFMGSVGATPSRCTVLEKVFQDRSIKELCLEELQVAAEQQIEELIPNRASKHYKKRAVKAVVEDMLEELRRKHGKQ